MVTPFVVLGMPGYGELTAGASKGFWRASRLPDRQICRSVRQGSLLAQNFNGLWCEALNLAREGRCVTHFAMQHSDIEPEGYWLDTLIEELEANDLDILGVAAPIKDQKGLSSIALAHPSGDTFRVLCRLTMAEIHRLPETFTSQDVGHPILLNTGLWVCRFREEWASQVRFTINDTIAQGPDGRYVALVEPEDWYFSRLCHELGLKIGCTRKVKLEHRGVTTFTNASPWGNLCDTAYVERSVLPSASLPGGFILPDVGGWLSQPEGAKLAELAKGKRALEIGSYLGLSTISMAREANQVVSVDPHDGRDTGFPRDTVDDFAANLERHAVADKVTIHIGTFDECRHDIDGPFDLIFIDGAHDRDQVSSDAAHALRLLAPDGLLAFHDYDPRHPGVTSAVDYLVSKGASLLSTTDSLAVVEPPASVSVLASSPQLVEA